MTRRNNSTTALDGFTQIHLLLGCCYCGCTICAGPHGIARTNGREGFELEEHARAIWRRHRTALLRVWRDAEAIPRAGGFSAEGCRGAGRWIPSFAEVKFENAEWPKQEKSWPATVRKLHAHISDELKRKTSGSIPTGSRRRATSGRENPVSPSPPAASHAAGQ